MKGTPGVWGIDLGQCALKAVRLEEQEGQIVATAFDYIEHPKILSQPDADPDQLTREALDKFLSRNSLRGDTVAVSVPGQSGLARFVKLPPVEEKKIADIVRFEAKQQIPFNLDEVIWDYQKVGSGTVMDGLAMDYEIGLFAMKRDQINRSIQYFKEVGIEVDVIQMVPLALCNFVAYELLDKASLEKDASESGSKSCVVALDMGADSSNLVITNGERIIWQKSINTGGNHFTRALTKDLKLTFAKAEHTKRNATKSPDLKKILAALKPVLNDLVNELQRSLNYFSNSHRDAQIEYLVGLGNAFRLPGLQRYLEEKLQISVRKLQKLKKLQGDQVLNQPVFAENVLSFPVAYGLALQGLRQSRLITNLLPNEIRVERLVRAKKPWAVAAAAALLLGLGGVALGTAMDYRAYAHKDVVDAITAAKSVDQRATQAETAYQQTRAAALLEEEGVKSVVAGQDERLNWLELMRFLGEAIPRPDGSNLSPQARFDYFESEPQRGTRDETDAMSGKRAFEELLRRQAGLSESAPDDTDTTDRAEDPLGRGIDDLIQLNIEAIDSRYTDNLGGYWRNLRTTVKDRGNVKPDSHWEKPPEGKGWVIEIRGYTFHHRQRRFVVETFLENLARVGIPDHGKQPSTAADPGTVGADPVLAGSTPAAGAAGLPDRGPVKNRVSHVVLFDARSEKAGDASSLRQMGGSVLDRVVAEGAGGGTGAGQLSGSVEPMTPPAGMDGGTPGQGAPAATRSGWRPLGTFSAVQGGTGIGSVDGGRIQPTTSGTPAAGARTGRHTRTEFVILLVWKEPTPSDSLRGQPAGGVGDPSLGMPTDPAFAPPMMEGP